LFNTRYYARVKLLTSKLILCSDTGVVCNGLCYRISYFYISLIGLTDLIILSKHRILSEKLVTLKKLLR